MPRPICVKCQIEYRPEKNGAIAEEMATGIGSYKIWSADLLKCPICGHLIISEYGNNPLAEHYDPDYEERRLAEVRTADGHAYLFYDRVDSAPAGDINRILLGDFDPLTARYNKEENTITICFPGHSIEMSILTAFQFMAVIGRLPRVQAQKEGKAA